MADGETQWGFLSPHDMGLNLKLNAPDSLLTPPGHRSQFCVRAKTQSEVPLMSQSRQKAKVASPKQFL